MRLGVGDRLEPCKIDNAEIIQNDIPSVNAVAGHGSLEKSNDEPPTTVSVSYTHLTLPTNREV